MILADVTITLPWAVWTAIGSTIVGAFGWLAKLTIKALNDSRASDERRHQEVVSLTREVSGALVDNSAATREHSKSIDALGSYIIKDDHHG